MILNGFVDELVKLGGVRCLVKAGYASMEPSAADIPHGMVPSGYVAPPDRLVPEEAQTRLPETGQIQSVLKPPGALGSSSEAKHPIDRKLHNRPFEPED